MGGDSSAVSRRCLPVPLLWVAIGWLLCALARAGADVPVVDVASLQQARQLQPSEWVGMVVDAGAPGLDALLQRPGLMDQFHPLPVLPRQADAWLAMRLSNPSDRPVQLVLDYRYHYIHSIEVGLLQAGQLTRHYLTGNSLPFATRPIAAPYYLFPLEIEARGEALLLVHVREQAREFLRLSTLWPQAAFVEAFHPRKSWLVSGLLGAMGLMALFSAVASVLLREPILGWYGLWVLSCLLGTLAGQGFGFMLLWPEAPWFELHAIQVHFALSMVLLSAFMSRLLGWREQHVTLYRISWGVILLGVGMLCWGLLWPRAVHDLGPLALVYIVASLFYVLAALWQWWRGDAMAGLFALCWLPILAGYGLIYAHVWQEPVVPSIPYGALGVTVNLVSVAMLLAYRQGQIRQREAEARAESQAKSDFLARMSHEIRTPMNGILGMTELLRDTGLNPLQRRYNEVIHASGVALMQVLNDILDYTRLEAGKMPLERLPVALAPFVEGVTALFQRQIESKGLQLRWEIDPELPEAVLGDPLRLRQIALNLLGNAIKFTEVGEVVLRLRRDTGPEARWCLEVQDTGRGLSEEECSQLFQRYSQAAADVARLHGGTGLGLNICRELVALMGGEIGVRSMKGEGSTFWVCLPLVPALTVDDTHEEGGWHRPWRPGRPWRVLVAEDNPVNSLVISHLLEKLGLSCELAGDGRQVVERVMASTLGFDLILMDVDMPVMDGLAATRQIRAWEAEQGRPRQTIVALTAHALQDFQARARDEGMDDFISKPVTSAALVACLERLENT